MKENLDKQGIKKLKGKFVNYISPSLLIRHKPTKIEYTVKHVVFKDKKPFIVAYRYKMNKGENEKVFIKISNKEFKDYETV